MAESKAKMKARLKALRKKHGLGEFGKRKAKKRKKRSVRSMAKKKRSPRRSSNPFSKANLGKAALGAAAGVIVPRLLPMPITQSPISKAVMGYMIGGPMGALGGFVGGTLLGGGNLALGGNGNGMFNY